MEILVLFQGQLQIGWESGNKAKYCQNGHTHIVNEACGDQNMEMSDGVFCCENQLEFG